MLHEKHPLKSLNAKATKTVKAEGAKNYHYQQFAKLFFS